MGIRVVVMRTVNGCVVNSQINAASMLETGRCNYVCDRYALMINPWRQHLRRTMEWSALISQR